MTSFVPIAGLSRQSSRREIYDAIDDLSVFHQHHALFPKAPSWDKLYACVRSYKRSHPAVGNIATAYRHHRLQVLGQLADSAKTPSIDRLRKRKDRACKRVKLETSQQQPQQQYDKQPQSGAQQTQPLQQQTATTAPPLPHSHPHPHPHRLQQQHQQQPLSPHTSVPSTPSPTSFLSSSSSSSFVDPSPLPSRGGCRCGSMVETNLRLYEELRRKDAELAALREKLSLMRGLIDGTAEQPADLILSSLPPAFSSAAPHDLQQQQQQQQQQQPDAADEWPDFIPALWSGSGGKQCMECSCCSWKCD